MVNPDPPPALAKTARCPICGKPAAGETRPFCSRRCANVDLARWFGGRYVVAHGGHDADEDGDVAGIHPSPAPRSDEPKPD